MKYDPNKHRRRSIRLKGYDYTQVGNYFITICTQSRKCIFGDIVDGMMLLSDAGKIVEKCWFDIPTHFPHVKLDEMIIMPNHVHGILSVTMNVDGYVGGDGVGPVGAKNFSKLQDHDGIFRPNGTSKTIGSVIRGFKIGVTKWMRQNTTVHDVWQRNYWERIVRDENELN